MLAFVDASGGPPLLKRGIDARRQYHGPARRALFKSGVRGEDLSSREDLATASMQPLSRTQRARR
jgi:hypothetical protein